MCTSHNRRFRVYIRAALLLHAATEKHDLALVGIVTAEGVCGMRLTFVVLLSSSVHGMLLSKD